MAEQERKVSISIGYRCASEKRSSEHLTCVSGMDKENKNVVEKWRKSTCFCREVKAAVFHAFEDIS